MFSQFYSPLTFRQNLVSLPDLYECCCLPTGLLIWYPKSMSVLILLGLTLIVGFSSLFFWSCTENWWFLYFSLIIYLFLFQQFFCISVFWMLILATRLRFLESILRHFLFSYRKSADVNSFFLMFILSSPHILLVFACWWVLLRLPQDMLYLSWVFINLLFPWLLIIPVRRVCCFFILFHY